MSKIRGIIALSLGFLIFAITMPPYCIAMLFLIPWRSTRIRMGNRYSQVIGPLLISFTGTKLNITGAEHLNPNRPAIYINNHSSNLDPLIAMSICPVGGCGISKKQLALIPFFGQIYWLSGHLLIDRSNRKQAIASIKEVTSIVEKNNLSLWIWPEGTRARKGKLTPFKKGFVHLALDTKLPIVPIISHNAHKRWPARTVKMFPGRLDIEVLPPIETKDWTRENLDQHLAEMLNLFNNKLDLEQRIDETSQSQV
jgi:1-acyl-sn-glycerol-3-phosphate acyltransferase